MAVVCLVLAFLCELVASLAGFGWLVHADHPAGWLALGLVFLVASMLVGALPIDKEGLMDPTEQPDNGRSEYQGTPFGGDKNTSSHVQPANLADAKKTLPGEQEDPRLC